MENKIIRKNYTVTQIQFQFSFIAGEAANNDKVFMSTMIVFFEYPMHLKAGRGINVVVVQWTFHSYDFRSFVIFGCSAHHESRYTQYVKNSIQLLAIQAESNVQVKLNTGWCRLRIGNFFLCVIHNFYDSSQPQNYHILKEIFFYHNSEFSQFGSSYFFLSCMS